MKARRRRWYVRSAGGRANPRLGSRRNRAARRRGRARRLRVPVRARDREPAGGEFGGATGGRPTFGSAIDDPGTFLDTLLDGLTFAGLLFIVASGFSLIFGLMRVVNMAHGAFYLLGGYIAYEIQQRMTGSGLRPAAGRRCSTWEWVRAAGSSRWCASPSSGWPSSSCLLRWNQGQDLRQALITIAVSVIVADQVIAHFPRTFRQDPEVRRQRGQHRLARLDEPLRRSQRRRASSTRSRGSSMLALGVAVGVALWLWLHRTRTGHGHPGRRRRPADDVGARGQHPETFAIAFVVGSALAAFGAVVGGSQGRRSPRARTAQWLLYSLVVVIIGGMGSLVGRRRRLAPATGSCSRSPPRTCRRHGQRLLHAVLDRPHVRAHGARARVSAAGTVREGGMTRDARARTLIERAHRRRGCSWSRRSRPAIFSDFWLNSILTQALILGIAAASLIFLSAYGGMISLAQTALMGIAGYALGEHGHAERARRRDEGSRSSAGIRRSRSSPAIVVTTVDRTRVRCRRVAELRDLLPDAHADLRGDRVPLLRLGDAQSAASRRSPASTSTRRRSSATSSSDPDSASTTSRSISRVFAYVLLRYVVAHAVRHLAPGHSATTRCVWRRSGTTSPLHRTLAFGFAAFRRRSGGRPLRLVERSARARPRSVSTRRSSCSSSRVIGGLGRIEGAWIGAFAFIAINNEVANRIPILGPARSSAGRSTR